MVLMVVTARSVTAYEAMCHFLSAIGPARFRLLLFKLAPAAFAAFARVRPFFAECGPLHFSGNGGCNRLIGGIELEGDRLCFGTALEACGAAASTVAAFCFKAGRQNRLLSRPGSEAGLIGPRTPPPSFPGNRSNASPIDELRQVEELLISSSTDGLVSRLAPMALFP